MQYCLRIFTEVAKNSIRVYFVVYIVQIPGNIVHLTDGYGLPTATKHCISLNRQTYFDFVLLSYCGMHVQIAH